MHLLNNFTYIKYSVRHIYMLNKVAIQLNAWKFRFIFHDLDKVLMYCILDKATASKYHRAHSSHHVRNNSVRDPLQAVLDWECSRYTKPDKPETAREFYISSGMDIPAVLDVINELHL